jgi:hypothetical protein
VTDGRQRNNLSVAQRRAIAKTAMRRRPKKKNSDLDKAKNVLRRHGKVVVDARILDPRDKTGSIFVDTRRHTSAQVTEMAQEIMRREAARNAELRRQFGLEEKR